MPEAASDRAPHIGNLYTLVPFLIIGVLFFFTVQSQNAVLEKEADDAVHVVDVIGQKWSWTFSYREADNPAIGTDAHTIGTLEDIPTLVLPLGEPVRFNLESADVIHSFWVPDFYFKLDVIPGHPNSFDVTPTKPGTFLGKCAELCGTHHAAMVFHVEVVGVDEYNARIRELAVSGNVGAVAVPQFPASGPRTEGGDRGHSRGRRTSGRHPGAGARTKGALIMSWMTTTDHEVIAKLYLWTALFLFAFGGLLALGIRAELAFPGRQYFDFEQFNQLFTMHGTIMLLMFATPMFAAFANALLPLHLGPPTCRSRG